MSGRFVKTRTRKSRRSGPKAGAKHRRQGWRLAGDVVLVSLPRFPSSLQDFTLGSSSPHYQRVEDGAVPWIDSSIGGSKVRLRPFHSTGPCTGAGESGDSVRVCSILTRVIGMYLQHSLLWWMKF